MRRQAVRSGMRRPAPAPTAPDDWLDMFRTIGTSASLASLDLAGTPEGAVELRRGAGGDMTIELDQRLEDIVIREVSRYRGIRLVSEECGQKDFGRPKASVIADPLDGSFNAKHGIPLYSISLAVAGARPTLGNVRVAYVRNLVTGDEFWAVRGKGAYRGSRRLATRRGRSIQVAAVEFHTARDIGGRAFRRPFPVLEDSVRIRSYGSIALELCFLACGSVDVVLDICGRQCRPLDLAAGQLMVTEAGGRVSDGQGRDLTEVPIDLETRTDFIATANAGVHARVLRGLTGTGPA